MNAAADLLTLATSAAFALLAVVATADWARHRDQRRGYLAIALVCLGIVSVSGQVARVSHLAGGPALVYEDLAVAVFLASGFFVLLFRHSLIPVPRGWLIAAGAAAGAALLATVVVALPAGPAPAVSPVQQADTALVVLVWSVMVGEPIWHFWRASGRLPRIQRQRMRALSLGFAALIGVLLASVATGSSSQQPAVRLVIQAVALATLPVFWVGLAPPAWLRRQWRAPEESELRLAIRDLLIFSPGRAALAEKAAAWAPRLTGGDGALLADSNGTILASIGLDPSTRDAIVAALAADPGDGIRVLPDGRSVIAATLPLESGAGALAVLAGPFTPVFGADDVVWLSAYASSVTAGLERARVTERLAAMERTKSQFLNLASHELRGPLTVLRGYVSMMEQGGFGELNDAGRRAVAVMGVKGAEMNGLVEQMLEAARLEEGRLRLNLGEHDLRDVVRQSIEQVLPLVDDRHEILVDAPSRPVTAEIDAERIQTIVANLLDNAVKYSPQGGEVSIQVANGHAGPAVRVRDRGLGIEAAHLATLFTRFGRIATPDTSHLPGTGLGLYLSRELARLHGGDITVESSPGAGSTFTLHLPSRYSASSQEMAAGGL